MSVCILLVYLAAYLKDEKKLHFLFTFLVLGQMISSVTRQHDTLKYDRSPDAATEAGNINGQI